MGADDGAYHTFSLDYRIENEEGIGGKPTVVDQEVLEEGAQNTDFDTEATGLLDFSESNPFGDPV